MNIVFSNSLNELVRAAANILKGERFDSPLAQDWIVVPNQDTGRWLQTKLTDQLGALINTRIIVLNDLMQVISKSNLSIQNSHYLYLAIAQNFSSSEGLDNPIDRVNEIETLVQIFAKYLLERPDWLIDWQKGGTKGLDTNKWQADLWRKISNGLPSPIHESIWSAAQSTGPLSIPLVARILIFEPTRLCEISQQILDRLEQAHPVICLVINPSKSLWYADGAFEDAETHNLLADLCLEKRAVVRDLMEKDTIDGYCQPSSNTSLRALQKSIFENSTRKHAIDDSINLVSAQTPTQEVEALRDWLILCLNKIPKLTLADVHVVTPDPALYGPIVQRIFYDKDALNAIPTAPDPLRNSSLIEICIRWIHNIFRNGFIASQCISLLNQPEIQRVLSLSDREISFMRDWLKQSGARRGIQGHKHSLTAARTRLVRGMMVDPEEALQSNAVLSEPIENTHAINQLLQIFDVVLHVSALPDEISLRALSVKLDHLLNKLTDGSLNSIALEALPSELLDEPLPIEVLFGFYRLIHKHGVSRQLAINDQISITSPQTIRSISAKVVAILGANDGTFPNGYHSHPWDHLIRHPRVGDENPATRDLQVFFDIFTNTTDAIWVSWLGQHPVTLKKELPGFGVISLLNCLVAGNGKSIVTELKPKRRKPFIGPNSQQTFSEKTKLVMSWHLNEFLNAIENPAKWFMKQRGARIHLPVSEKLSFEPTSIDQLTRYKFREKVVHGADLESIRELFQIHPELPQTLSIDKEMLENAPNNVIEIARRRMDYKDLGILKLGEYTLALDAMRDPNIPWIIIDKDTKGQRFLRAMVECLVHFASKTTTKQIQLLLFNNRAYPISALPQDDALNLLKKWLNEFAAIGRGPLSLISPLAIRDAESFNSGKQDEFQIHWHDDALIHRLEYRRLLYNMPNIHQDYTRLIKELVAPLLKQRGKGSAAL